MAPESWPPRVACQFSGKLFSRFVTRSTRVYRPGQALPWLRASAVKIRVNPNAVQRALEELEPDGVITSSTLAAKIPFELLVQNLKSLLDLAGTFLGRTRFAEPFPENHLENSDRPPG